MKMRNLLFILLVGSLTITSCKKDEAKNDVNIPDTKFEDVDYGTASIDQNKEKLDNSGSEFVTEISSLKDEEAISVVMSFMNRMNGSSSIAGASKLPVIKSMLALKNIKQGGDFNQLTKSLTVKISEDPTSIQDAYDQLKGVYEWDAVEETFVNTGSASNIQFKFPATEGGSINNAVLTIKDYSGYTPSTPIEGYEGDLPTRLNADLKVDGTVVMAYTFSASYKSNGEPEIVTTSLSVGEFKLTIALKNTTTEVGYRYLFEKGTTILFDMAANVIGDFTKENIEAVSTDDNSAEVKALLDEANAYIQVMNVKIAGKVNFDGLIDDMNAISEIAPDSIAMAQSATALNDNAQLIVFFTDTKEKIADAKAYSFMTSDTYYDYIWNSETLTYDQVLVTENNAEMGMMFEFADGTSMTAETFFTEGFTKVQNDFDNLMSELEAEYGK
jgi:hypothetical protein